MIDGVKCTLNDLQVAINIAYEQESSGSIQYPPLGDICRWGKKDGEMWLRPLERGAFQKSYDAFCGSNQECQQEIPKYDYYLEAFYCAGIPPLAAVEKFLSNKIRYRDVLRGEKPLWLGYDTCVLRRRLYSVLRKMLSNQGLHDTIGHAVVNGVTDELHYGMDKKYKSDLLGQFEKSFPEAASFLNQAKLEARLHRIGLMDIDQMKKHDVYQELPSKRGDLNIIKGYAEFEKNRNAEVVLFSADNNFVEMAADSSLTSYCVKYNPGWLQKFVKSKPISLDTFTSILYHLSIVFGLIRMKDFTIRSIWKGKGVQDWKKGLIMVWPDQSVEKEFTRTIMILDKLRDNRLYRLY